MHGMHMRIQKPFREHGISLMLMYLATHEWAACVSVNTGRRVSVTTVTTGTTQKATVFTTELGPPTHLRLVGPRNAFVQIHWKFKKVIFSLIQH